MTLRLAGIGVASSTLNRATVAENMDQKAQFRHYDATAKILESFCGLCHKTIAFAPQDDMLRMADRAHICRAAAANRSEALLPSFTGDQRERLVARAKSKDL